MPWLHVQLLHAGFPTIAHETVSQADLLVGTEWSPLAVCGPHDSNVVCRGRFWSRSICRRRLESIYLSEAAGRHEWNRDLSQ